MPNDCLASIVHSSTAIRPQATWVTMPLRRIVPANLTTVSVALMGLPSGGAVRGSPLGRPGGLVAALSGGRARPGPVGGGAAEAPMRYRASVAASSTLRRSGTWARSASAGPP